jgi:hypothetical protein
VTGEPEPCRSSFHRSGPVHGAAATTLAPESGQTPSCVVVFQRPRGACCPPPGPGRPGLAETPSRLDSVLHFPSPPHLLRRPPQHEKLRIVRFTCTCPSLSAAHVRFPAPSSPRRELAAAAPPASEAGSRRKASRASVAPCRHVLGDPLRSSSCRWSLRPR